LEKEEQYCKNIATFFYPQIHFVEIALLLITSFGNPYLANLINRNCESFIVVLTFIYLSSMHYCDFFNDAIFDDSEHFISLFLREINKI